MRVLVTGAGGFVGRALCAALTARGMSVVATGRKPPAALPGVVPVGVGDLDGATDWTEALAGVERVVHLAARTHVTRETAGDTLSAYRRINAGGTRRLAEQAAQAGIARLLFVSSIKVNGNATGNKPFIEDGAPRFDDAYGRSKWEAEQALWQVAKGSPLAATVLRPPLVYGPGVKGNFLALLKACSRRWPLPLDGIGNRRSLIGLTNLVDAIVAALMHPAAGGRTYLVRDGEELSTSALIRRISAALGVAPRLWPAPQGLLRLGASATGHSEAAKRLLDSLEIDDSRIRHELGWSPPCSVDEELAATARWFLAPR